jgi:hypothetical protein
VANIVMVECRSSFGTDIQAAYEMLAGKITEEIKDDEHYFTYGRDYHEAIIKKILDRQITDTFIYTAHVQILFDGFEDYLFLAAVDIRQSKNKDLKQVRDMLVQRHPSFKFAIYSDYILMIMSSKNNCFSPEVIIGDQENPFEQNDFFFCISSRFENLYELEKYYNEAITALKNGIAASASKRQHIFQFGSV